MWFKDRPLALPQATTAFNDLVATAADVRTFLAALVRGDVSEQPATADLMQQRWNRIVFPLHYGRGMMRFRLNRLAAPGRRPVTLVGLIGHLGASGSWAFHCPELDVTMAGTVDQSAARRLPFRLMARVLRIVA